MQDSSTVKIRQARISDVEDLVRVDIAQYSDMTADFAENSNISAMFARRISNTPGWFWVALVDGRIEGLLSTCPTTHSPEGFVSWEKCTNNGTLDGIFDERADFLYGVALTVTAKGGAAGVTKALLAAGLARFFSSEKRTLYLSGRMPGYHKVADEVSPQEYYDAQVTVRGQRVARDPQVRMYERLGFRRAGLVPGGFAVDHESAGYGVLLTMENPFREGVRPEMLNAMCERIAKQDDGPAWLTALS
ncbi:hypothetical protein ACFVFJ_50150 [Streptomyces sp. NPDC057717]|uniref:hypothetical protein n=1 Tax=Streptomyces sp. NPDC057717 TaxID=3346224 RepID=UPI003699855E